jgi:hypothetical protein
MRWTVSRDIVLPQQRQNLYLRQQYTLFPVPFNRLLKSLLLIGMATTLVSCSQIKRYQLQLTKQKPEKVFKYVFQEPKRSQLAANFAKQLSGGKDGSLVTIRLQDHRVKKARLGRQYFSASGYQCRKYTLQGSPQPQIEYASCLINGRWLNTSPIVHDANSIQQTLKTR